MAQSFCWVYGDALAVVGEHLDLRGPIVTAHVISARDQPNSSDIGFKKMPKKDPFSPTRGIPPESTTPTMNQP